MGNQDESFDAAYRRSDRYFGDGPEKLLVEYREILDPGRPVLDVGAGQGRNALYLAGAGFEVDAVDPSAEAVRATSEAARREALTMRVVKAGFEELGPQAAGRTYGTICLFGLIPLLTRPQIELLMDKVKEWSDAGTVLFVTAFTDADPSFAGCSAAWRRIARNSFQDRQGVVRTFLAAGEAVALFPGFEILHHREGPGPEHRHGDGPVQRHELVELVLRR